MGKKSWPAQAKVVPVVACSLLLGAAFTAQGSDGAETPGTTTAVSAPVTTISSPVPSYIDQGTTMVPLRPVADFLGIKLGLHDGVLTLSQRDDDSGKLIVAVIRLNGRSAQVTNGSTISTVTLPLAVESRLGNTFVPLRFLSQVFDAAYSFRVPDNAIVLRMPRKIGILVPDLPTEYTGRTATTLTLVNHIGKPMSLRLNGPQKIALELGRGQKITRRLAPGVYYYKAVCAKMRPRSGARRLYPGRRVNWIWGRE